MSNQLNSELIEFPRVHQIVMDLEKLYPCEVVSQFLTGWKIDVDTGSPDSQIMTNKRSEETTLEVVARLRTH